jgi:hypothetical protein
MSKFSFSQLSHLVFKLKDNRRALILTSFSYVIDVILPDIIKSKKSETEIYVSVEESIGRYLFIFLRFLTYGKNTVTFLNKISFWDYLDKYGKMSLKLKNVIYSKQLPSISEDKILIYEQPKPELMNRKWKKLIQVNFDISLPQLACDNWAIMPYPMHPLVYATEQHEEIYHLRQNARKTRILFAGNTDARLYANPKNTYLHERFNKLLRPQIIQTVISGLASEVLLVKNPEQMRLVLKGNYPDKCVIIDQNKLRIPNVKWLEFLSKSNFFLCPPGVYMPLCHNAVEAMAVGTIPIINYAEWFKPRLEHLKNCIEFRDEVDLIRQVKYALTMDQLQIHEIRNNVIEYHEKYLSIKSFHEQVIHHLNDRTTLFVNAEQVPYLQKLQWDSVIFSQTLLQDVQ